MKKTQITKILLLVLSLVLLVGAAVGIAASAEESDAYRIKKVSIAHGERTFVLMAVDISIENADNVEVKYTLDGTEYVAKRYGSNYVDKATEVAYPVYYTHGISPQDIGEDIIAEAHKIGAADYTPIEFNVCIAEYLYNQLYAEGLISATSGSDLSYKNLCQAHLIYGAAAEQALHNEKAENKDNQKVLITERSYVYSAFATINGTTAKEIILPGKTGSVTLAANENAPANRAGWVVTTYAVDGSTSAKTFTGDTVEITGHSVITPATDPVYDFEGSTALPAGVTITGNTKNCLNNGAAASVVTLEGNNVLKVSARDAYYNYSTSSVDWSLSGANTTAKFLAQDAGREGYKVAFDITFSEAASYSSASSDTVYVYLYNGDTKVGQLPMRLYKDGRTTLGIKENLTSAGYFQYNFGEKIHIELEYIYNASISQYRLAVNCNGVSHGDFALSDATFSEITHANISFGGGAHAEAVIDNVKVHN